MHCSPHNAPVWHCSPHSPSAPHLLHDPHIQQTATESPTHALPLNRAATSPTSGICTSFMNRTPRFSSTMPSDAAKKASTCEMKCFSPSFSVSQSWTSLPRSTSSAAGQPNGVGGYDGCRQQPGFGRMCTAPISTRKDVHALGLLPQWVLGAPSQTFCCSICFARQRLVLCGARAAGLITTPAGTRSSHPSRRKPQPSCTSACAGSPDTV